MITTEWIITNFGTTEPTTTEKVTEMTEVMTTTDTAAITKVATTTSTIADTAATTIFHTTTISIDTTTTTDAVTTTPTTVTSTALSATTATEPIVAYKKQHPIILPIIVETTTLKIPRIMSNTEEIPLKQETPTTCKDMPFGCCRDGITPAKGYNFSGCVKSSRSSGNRK